MIESTETKESGKAQPTTIPRGMIACLRDPAGLAPLELDGDTLVNRTSGRRYFIRDSIPLLVDETALGPQNAKIQKFYRRMAGVFDIGDRVANWLTRGSLIKMRRQMVSRLGLKPGQRLLYTSIGTGLDLPFLAEQVPLDSLEFVGLDLSLEMLRVCQARMPQYAREALLVQANAERLPLAGGRFDVVLHVGGINQFDDPAAAVREMLRVARPGARLFIADETKKMVKTFYQKWLPDYRDMPTEFDPRDWLPPGVQDAAYEEVARGRIYFLTFTAPKE